MVTKKISEWSTNAKESLVDNTKSIVNKTGELFSEMKAAQLKQLFSVASTEEKLDTTYYFLFPDPENSG